MANSNFIPVKKVIRIINSCETEQQLKNCLRVIRNYTELLKSQGVINTDLVEKRLIKEYKQKKFQIKMIGSFVMNYRQVFNQEILAASKKNKMQKVA